MADSLKYCPIYAPVLGSIGIASAIIFSSLGAAYGTAKAGLGIINVSITRPDLMMRSAMPVIMAGILALYGVVVDAIILTSILLGGCNNCSGAMHLGSGLLVGFSGLAAGIAIGIVGDAGVRGVAQQPRVFVGMVLILIFAEVLGIYGFFLGIMMSHVGTKGMGCSNA
ncbi:V-type proton ATPase proteolipid subunit [Paramicrosporidium saccamoebae]|uniref:V-type proton ATPase proteolipid subunit n=1 Tax=Paramicrosporidium saccamoebae TaxID=1246581 RepID=A0A2H9THT3_9FUNG|nr:V-type proton ATPase proteolipid subunit [Paramicrosporidium saccamoebae]